MHHDHTALLADFYDVDGFVKTALTVLNEIAAYRTLGEKGIEVVRQKYSLEICLTQIVNLYEAA